MALAKGSQTIVPQLIAKGDFLDFVLYERRRYGK